MNFNEMKKEEVKTETKTKIHINWDLALSWGRKGKNKNLENSKPKNIKWTLELFDLNKLFVNLIEEHKSKKRRKKKG